MIQNDPASVVMAITDALKEIGMSLDDLLGTNDDDEGNGSQGVDSRDTKIAQLEEMIGNLHGELTSFKDSQTESQQLEQLDKLLSDMHSEHGEFPDEYVLLQLEKGLSPEDAVKAWNKEIEKFSSPKKPAPVLLSSNGAVKQPDQVDVSKLSTADRKAYVLSIMTANQDT